MANDSDDDVGYGRPPKHSQFKKGQSGNPKGRRPKSRNTSTLLAEELDKLITVKDGSGERRLSKREALMTSLVNDAITGKNQARPLLLRILEVSNPPEPFLATDEDAAALDAFIERRSAKRSDGDLDDEQE
jgi:hypothetical protein